MPSLLHDTQVLEELRKEHSFSLVTDVKDGSGMYATRQTFKPFMLTFYLSLCSKTALS